MKDEWDKPKRKSISLTMKTIEKLDSVKDAMEQVISIDIPDFKSALTYEHVILYLLKNRVIPISKNQFLVIKKRKRYNNKI